MEAVLLCQALTYPNGPIYPIQWRMCLSGIRILYGVTTELTRTGSLVVFQALFCVHPIRPSYPEKSTNTATIELDPQSTSLGC